MTGTEKAANGHSQKEQNNGSDKASSPSSLLYSSAGSWRPPGVGVGTLPTPLSRPSTASGQRPVTARPGKALRPTSARPPQLPTEAELFDGASILINAAINSQTVEERALGQDIRKHAFTIPEKTGSHGVRAVAASFFAAPVAVPSMSASYMDPYIGMSSYNPGQGMTTSSGLAFSPTTGPAPGAGGASPGNNSQDTGNAVPAGMSDAGAWVTTGAHHQVSQPGQVLGHQVSANSTLTSTTAGYPQHAAGTPPRPGKPPTSPHPSSPVFINNGSPVPGGGSFTKRGGNEAGLNSSNRWGPPSTSIGAGRPGSAPRGHRASPAGSPAAADAVGTGSNGAATAAGGKSRPASARAAATIALLKGGDPAVWRPPPPRPASAPRAAGAMRPLSASSPLLNVGGLLRSPSGVRNSMSAVPGAPAGPVFLHSGDAGGAPTATAAGVPGPGAVPVYNAQFSKSLPFSSTTWAAGEQGSRPASAMPWHNQGHAGQRPQQQSPGQAGSAGSVEGSVSPQSGNSPPHSGTLPHNISFATINTNQGLPLHASPAGNAGRPMSAWTLGTTANYSVVSSRPGTAMSQKAGPPGSAGSGNPLDERQWSPDIESALSQHAAAVAHLNTINPALPKKFPGSERPLSAFSTATGITRSSQAASAFGALVPQNASVAEQPVYSERDGTAIATSQDVIDYFTANGHSAHKKLFYLNKAKRLDPLEIISPFDLVVVPAEKVESEYWTMSVMGVTRVTTDGPKEGEYMELGEWIRLSSIFGMLRKMRVFKYYYLSKAFRLWRQNVRSASYHRVRKEIGRQLYSAIPTFQPFLRKLYALVTDIATTPINSINNRPDKLYTLEEFVEDQEKHRERVTYANIQQKVSQIVELLLETAGRAEAERLKMEAMGDIQELKENNFVVGMPSMPAGMKNKSISTMKQERVDLMNQYKQVVHEVSRLKNLARLVDYMVGEAYVSLAVRAVEELRAYFDDPSKVRGCLNTTIGYVAGGGYSFSPDEPAVLEGITHIIDDAVRLANDLPRPLTSKAVTAKFLQQGEQILNVNDVCFDTPRFLNERNACTAHVASSFVRAAEYVHATFEDKRTIEEFRTSWDPSKYEAETGELRVLRKDLVQQRRWGRQVDQMKMSSTVGILFVDSKRMRSTLQDSILATIESMKVTLANLARRTCQQALEQARQWNKELEARPVELDGYVRLKIRHTAMERTKEELFQLVTSVDDMYDTYKDYGGKVDIKDNVQLDNLHEDATALKANLSEVEAWLGEQHTEKVVEMQATSAKLVEDVLGMLTQMGDSSALNDPESEMSEMMAVLGALERRLAGMEELSKTLTSYQRLLQEPQEDYGSLVHVRREFDRRKTAWTTLAEWTAKSHAWLHSPVATLNAEAIQAEVDEYFKSVYKMCKMYRDDMVVVKAKDMIDAFKVYLPLFTEVANPAMQQHHWAQVFIALGVAIDETTPVSAHDLVGWGVMGKLEQVSAISTSASKEYSLRKALAKMKEEWVDKEFYCIPYKDTGTAVIGQTDEIQMLLDDQLMKVQAMNASPFVKPFRAETVEWEATLQFLQDMIDQWVVCQATWMYLEPIFSSEDIIKQMPEEGQKFSRVDTSFRALMEEVSAAPAVIPLAKDPERLEALKEANRLLEEVQKGLAAYLEKKRLFFPRFFFLSNDEMLEILSETKDPTRVQPHLRKCFEGIHRLKFEGAVVNAMSSVEGEMVPFKTAINTAQAKGAVERWLLEVEERMFEAVHDVTGRGVLAYPGKPRHEWVLEWPGMVVLVVTGIFWTRAVEAALSQGPKGVKACEESCTQELMKIVNLVRGELTGLQRATLGALVVMDVHARDVVTSLVEGNVQDAADFAWTAQLRTYWEKSTNQAAGQPEREFTVIMRMMSSVLEYGYEYLGNSSRLVITPLTDRCYRTLMGAIHMTLGGAPEGPAGTGKTETTKDLAKALARQCVVFNCSDSLDYLAMGKFFKGLAASGAWACFDEFNRIDLEVLSVVAQQVMDIQRAISARLTAFTFEGTDMQLKWSAWCAITMNPGYAGRSELPDNLKALFRTVAMMVPDYAMIAEIMLFSYGYLAARECAKKIVQCYKLCSEQLSSQDHYDYGMRAVMAVLRAAGNLKRRFPQEDEFVLMLRSIMDVNLCKFLSHDVPLFQGIISDLFPGVTLPEPDYNLMNAAIRDACAAMNLQPTPYFMLKTIQLYEMIVVRHGLMLVGLPFSGKTASYRVLAQALSLMNERGQEGQEKAQYYVINPKSITMGQLYGQFDPVSHEWSDGVLAVTFRRAASDPSPARKWLVLDGPVDAIWIENMNTVLDDNKKLCLNSGEIIQMSPQMNMIFEVMDLAVASPATVSRCGMVYLEPHQLGVAPLLTSWLASLPSHYPDTMRMRLEELFNAYTLPLVRLVRKEVREASPTPEGNAPVALMRLWASLALPIMGTPEQYKKQEAAKLKEAADALFVFSLLFSVGITAATAEGRSLVGRYLRAAFSGTLSTFTSPAGINYSESSTYVELVAGAIPPPLTASANEEAAGEAYDWMYDVTQLTWRKWTDLIDPVASAIPSGAAFKSIIVPTSDSVTITYLLRLSVDHKYPLLLVGPTGTGKTAYTQAYLLKLDPEQYTPPNFIGFSAQTSANMTQGLIDAKLDKRRKGVYGPPVGKIAVIFVDDLNMPQKEVYGAQPPIELLRQFMDHGGWYDRDNSFRAMQDVHFLAAMGPPGGGRTFITPRYLRHFHVVGLTEASATSLTHIFKTIQDWFLTTRTFPVPVLELRDTLIAATMDVYATVAAQLLPTPTKSHYIFNLRDFSRVIQGVQMQDPRSLASGAQAAGTGPAQQHIKLWCHEVLRVFYDRLVDESEQVWFLDTLKSVTQRHFHASFDALFQHLTRAPGQPSPAAPGGAAAAALPGKQGDATQVTTTHLRRCFFGDYMADMDETGTRPYQEILDPEAIISRMDEYLLDYNSLSKRPMNLAMFLYAVEHVSRAARVLRQEGGHILCVGVGGSGRQSLARLGAFISGMEAFQIEISRNYGPNEWREDLKRFCRRAGAENKPCVFLFSDTQIKAESFVEDINNLLNSGEVPNMFPYDERTTISEIVRTAAKKAGRLLDTPSELWAYFVERTRANLHLVLCFSPIGDAFRERLRQFPSLINCCTIDWFQKWPEDALEAVATKFLREVDVLPDMRKSLMAMCKHFHTSVDTLSRKYLTQAGRRNYVTPTSYLELITMFTTLLSAKRSEVLAAQHRYEIGLEKLEFTAGQVEAMRQELRALKPVLQKTVAETDKLLEQIARDKTEVVEPKKAIVDAEVKAADVKAQEARAIKEECEAILAEALPALNAAISALDTIKKSDIQLVQSFKNPPAAVKLVMEAVCVLLDAKPNMVADPNMPGKKIADYWDTSKKLLMDSYFINRLKEYDRDNIPAKIIDKIRREYCSDPEFTPANAAKASSAAEGLCKWVYAMESYDRVAKIVAPKRASLREAEAAYESVMLGLRAKQAELKEVMDRLAALEEQLRQSMAKKDRLEAEVELCTIKLDRAEKLISGLGGEKDRWTEAAQNLRNTFNGLTGDMLVSAAVISYLGAFTAGYREEAVSSWLATCKKVGIHTSARYSLTAALGEPVKIRAWVIDGLPNDSFSVENGIMMTNARRWPLCIDPQKQANKWIKNMEAERKLVVMKLSDGDYIRVLENAIVFGLPVLLENVGEELDPSLEPVLLKQIFKQGGVLCLKLGDSVVEYNDSFRFYITTALRNPHYLPETAVKVTLLNFMITQEGLSDQLLGVVVAQEMPELEEQRQQLVVTSAENKRRLKEIEDQILHVLSSSQGNILEDASAVAILSEAKKVSDDISAKQAVAEETQTKIDAARRGYRPCGEYNAVLFFCIADLAGVDAMYQYSLPWFISLFQRAISESTRSDMLGKRLESINDTFTYSLYANICRSLFEKDKLLFSFLLATRVMRHTGKLPSQEYEFLVTGGANVAPAAGAGSSGGAAASQGGAGQQQAAAPNPDPTWISPRTWEEVVKLSRLTDAFHTLPGQISLAKGAWKEAIYDSSQPHAETLPAPFDKSLSNFQRLLILRALRPDKFVPAVATFVTSTLGPRFTEPPPFDLASAFADSSATTPLLFVLSPGTDPTASLLSFAESRGQSGGKLQVISMGQGQGPKAAALIEDARQLGTWVLLQNCHLAPSWMPALERICEGLTPETTDERFRLWMTSMPSDAFPPTILQNCVKMTNEPPAGLKANMRRCLALDPLCAPETWEVAPGEEGPCHPQPPVEEGEEPPPSPAHLKAVAIKRLLFSLVFIHAFVQERRKFGPIGWNIAYGFDDGDLRISARQARMYVLANKDVPFAALKYAIGECNYGGRVTDDKDRRLLNTLMDKLYCTELLQQANFKLSESGTYFVPKDGGLIDYISYIESLPSSQAPEVFGLSPNADTSKDLHATDDMLAALLSTGGAGGSGGGAESAAQAAAVGATVADILGRLPPDFDLEAAGAKYPVSYDQSMNQVLVQEMARYNRLLAVIRTSLVNLDKALQGLQVLSSELDGVLRSLAVGKVPPLWLSSSYPSLKPLASYVADLLARLEMLQSWYEVGQPPVFWISGFFFTPSFTTAVLQNYARKHRLPIDSITFEFEMLGPQHAAMGMLDHPPAQGVYIKGLYLEGCGWDHGRAMLCESQPKVLFVEAPVIHFQPVRIADLKPTPSYECPVYRTADRRGVLATTGHSTNFLTMIRMPTDQPAAHWTLRGVCMLCSLSD